MKYYISADQTSLLVEITFVSVEDTLVEGTIVSEEGWFCQPKYSTAIYINSTLYRFLLYLKQFHHKVVLDIFDGKEFNSLIIVVVAV